MKLKTRVLLLLCLMPWIPITAHAESNPWTNTFYFENDMFNGTDSNYTNGVKYSIISPNLSPHAPDGKLPRRVLEYIQKLPLIAKSTPNFTHKVEFSLGQNMYTPANISETELIVDDRPYAGWTYLATAYHRKNEQSNLFQSMDTLEIQFGIVGPESLAEDCQKFVHEVRDLTRPNGWDNQLDNEPGLAIVYEHKWLYRPGENETFGYSAMGHAGAALGNVYTYANAGAEFRFGWHIPKDFGVSLIRPAGSTRLEIGPAFTLYLFGAVNGRAVAHSIFLDGNTFTDSHSVDKKHFVADLAGGLAIGYKQVMITWTEVYRTKQFHGQSDQHSYGSIALSFSFPFDFS